VAKRTQAVLYLRTSIAANVGADRDSDKRQHDDFLAEPIATDPRSVGRRIPPTLGLLRLLDRRNSLDPGAWSEPRTRLELSGPSPRLELIRPSKLPGPLELIGPSKLRPSKLLRPKAGGTAPAQIPEATATAAFVEALVAPLCTVPPATAEPWTPVVSAPDGHAVGAKRDLGPC